MLQTERYGDYEYKIPVTNGTYRVEMYFTEMYVESSGERVFDLSIEGNDVLTSLDIFSEVGQYSMYSYESKDIKVTDEELNIALDSVEENPTMSGFAVYSADGEFVEPPPPPPIERSAENPGADCDVPNVPTSANNSKLPDPFTMIDGTPVTTKEQWRCRRQEILRMAEENTHGGKPPPPPAGGVTSSLSGNTLTINISDNGKSGSFSVTLSGTGGGAVPAVISYGNSGPISSFPSGVATINYSPTDVGAETGEGRRKAGLFFDLYGDKYDSTGTLVAWSWGVSRIIDAIEQQWEEGNEIIIPERIGVTGCSRFGKGAFNAGVWDARVALTIPMESGTGGSVSWRKAPQVNGSQPLSSAYGEQPWMGDAFGGFTSNPDSIPIDTHQLVGAVAPRGFIAVERLQPDWLATQASLLAVQAGQKIYEALGAEEAISYISVSGSSHCQAAGAFDAPVAAMVKKYLLGESASTGQINTAGSLENLGNWVDWETPTLTED